MDSLENDSRTAEIVVIKVGTTTLTRGQPRINTPVMADLARQIVAIQRGNPDGPRRGVILVSSAAIAMGREKLAQWHFHLSTEGEQVESLVTKQMLAAIGQPQLIQLYQQVFATNHNVLTAQALLTYSDFSTEQRRDNARNTLLDLLRQGIVPVVNENDVIATEEIRFGDNDKLSAMVADLVGANLLLILSDIDGLYTANPRLDPHAILLKEVPQIDDRILAMAGGSLSGQGTGGMISKVLAAQIASQAGVPTVLVNGLEPDALVRVVAGELLGTRFLSA